MKWYVCWRIDGESGVEECETKADAEAFMDRIGAGYHDDKEFKVILGEEKGLIDATRLIDLPGRIMRIRA